MSEIEPTHLAAVLHNNKNVFAQLLVSYFEENFTGSHFEFWDDQAGIQNNENKITSADVYSTSFLGVDVPPHAGMSFVNGPDSKLISELLSKLPLNTALDEYSNFPLDTGSIADQLWTLLNKDGMGDISPMCNVCGEITMAQKFCRNCGTTTDPDFDAGPNEEDVF